MKPGNRIALSTKMAQENWENAFYVQDVDGKVEMFNDIVMNILNKTMPERNVRFHPSEKPWMTRHIKTQIKARQRPFSRRDKTNYECLCKKSPPSFQKLKVFISKIKLKTTVNQILKKVHLFICRSRRHVRLPDHESYK